MKTETDERWLRVIDFETEKELNIALVDGHYLDSKKQIHIRSEQ